MELLKNPERFPWKLDPVHLSLIFAGNQRISTVVSELLLSFIPPPSVPDMCYCQLSVSLCRCSV